MSVTDVAHLEARPVGQRPAGANPAGGAVRAAKRVLKWLALGIGFVVAALPVLTAKLEEWLSRRDGVFLFWGQAFALVPGSPGKLLRRCYYFGTLKSCRLDWEIGFLSYFTHRRAEVGRRVYIGVAAHLASVTIGDGSLIGSRVSILSGKQQHRFDSAGKLTPFDPTTAPQIHVGAETWIGEGAILMADVGSRCIVAAGSVVSNPVPDGCTVGGNPARFIGKTGPWADDGKEHDSI